MSDPAISRGNKKRMPSILREIKKRVSFNEHVVHRKLYRVLANEATKTVTDEVAVDEVLVDTTIVDTDANYARMCEQIGRRLVRGQTVSGSFRLADDGLDLVFECD